MKIRNRQLPSPPQGRLTLPALPDGACPLRLVTHDLLDEVVRLHDRSMDFEEGDLTDRLYRYASYALKCLPVANLPMDEWETDEDKVNAYAALSTAPPPLVYDPHADSIIDGTHRLAAARLRGQTQVWAYVGEGAPEE